MGAVQIEMWHKGHEGMHSEAHGERRHCELKRWPAMARSNPQPTTVFFLTVGCIGFEPGAKRATRMTCPCRIFFLNCGMYWIRTNDPYPVKVVL